MQPACAVAGATIVPAERTGGHSWAALLCGRKGPPHRPLPGGGTLREQAPCSGHQGGPARGMTEVSAADQQTQPPAPTVGKGLSNPPSVTDTVWKR